VKRYVEDAGTVVVDTNFDTSDDWLN